MGGQIKGALEMSKIEGTTLTRLDRIFYSPDQKQPSSFDP
jgi:hypothetical protein